MNYIRQNEIKKIRKSILGIILYVFSILIITFAILFFVCEKTMITGDSMYPSLEDGEEIMIDKVTYHFREPKRFEIIVFKFRYLADTYYVKRIIGLPGEKVQIKDGHIYINDVLLSDNHGYEDYIVEPGLAEEPIVLGDDEYFVLGDNRNVSKDSRDKTVYRVKKEDFVGRAFFKVFPISKFGFVNHK